MNVDELRKTLPAIEINPESAQDKAGVNALDRSKTIAQHATARASRKGFSAVAKALVIAVVIVVAGGVGVAAALNAGLLPLGSSKEMVSASVADSKGTVSSKVDGALVYYKMANRGTTIDVTGEDGIYYKGTVDGVNVFVEKKWVRLANAVQPSPWKGYSNEMVPLYKTAFLLGDPITLLPLNTEVEVQDEQDEWLFVRTADGVQGYAHRTDFRNEEQKRAEDEAEGETAAENGSWYGNSWYNDSPNETYYEPAPEQNPDPQPAPVPTGNDGQEIELVAFKPIGNPFVENAYAAELSPKYGSTRTGLGKGTVLSDGVSLFLTKLKRGETVTLLNSNERSGNSSATILVKVGDYHGTITRSIVRLADDPPFKAIDVYTREGATVFSDFQMQSAKRTCEVNTVLHVVDEYDTNYVIDESGVFTYIPKDSVSLTKLEIKQEEESAAESEWVGQGYNSSYSGGTGNGEGYYVPPSDSSSNSVIEPEPAAEPGQEWTDAVL